MKYNDPVFIGCSTMALFSFICVFFFAPYIFDLRSDIDVLKKNQSEFLYFYQNEKYMEKECAILARLYVIKSGGSPSTHHVSLTNDGHGNYWAECTIRNGTTNYYYTRERLRKALAR